jgi:hypothetical protein
MQQKTCCWVLKPFTRTEKAVFCGKKVRWTMVKDDDRNTVRLYKSFCEEHQKIVDEMTEDDEE